MVDANSRAGQQAVERAAKAAQTNNLGPGTVGYTTSGAAYQGQNVADARGLVGPAEPGFGSRTGLGYTEGVTPAPDYPAAQTVPGAADRGDFRVTAGMAGPTTKTGPWGETLIPGGEGTAAAAGAPAGAGFPSEVAGPPADFIGPPYAPGQNQARQNQAGRRL